MNDFADDLARSLKEAAQMSKGAPIGRVHAPVDPRAIRRKAGLTQAQMAHLMGMSLSGYRKWEQGARQVSGPALTLLRVIEKNPRAVLDAAA